MTDPAQAPRYRKPAQGDVPDPVAIGEQAEFTAVADGSQTDVAASAERWRTGLAGLTAVVTGGLLLKGPESAADLEWGWRLALTGLFGLGIVISVAGFWWALRASAGVPATVQFDEVRTKFGSVRLYRLDLARRAADELRWARRAALVSTVLLAAGVITWWWAPPKSDDKPTVIVTHGAMQSCGELVDSDANGLRLAASGNPTRVTIPWATIEVMKIVTSCSAAPK